MLDSEAKGRLTRQVTQAVTTSLDMALLMSVCPIT